MEFLLRIKKIRSRYKILSVIILFFYEKETQCLFLKVMANIEKRRRNDRLPLRFFFKRDEEEKYRRHRFAHFIF